MLFNIFRTMHGKLSWQSFQWPWKISKKLFCTFKNDFARKIYLRLHNYKPCDHSLMSLTCLFSCETLIPYNFFFFNKKKMQLHTAAGYMEYSSLVNITSDADWFCFLFRWASDLEMNNQLTTQNKKQKAICFFSSW